MFFAGKGFRPNAFQTRRILIVSGAAVALLAAAAWTFISVQGPTATRSVADAAPAATPSQPAQPARPYDRAGRADGRTPLGDPAADADRRTTAAKPVERPAKKTRTAPRVLSAGSCEASFYSEPQATASGERFDPGAMTAAHKTLPLGSRVRVINKSNGDSVTVRINDRGPYIAGRCIDLSRAAMAAVGGIGSGVIPVRYEVLTRA